MACVISRMCVGIRRVVCGGLWGVGSIGRGMGSRNVKGQETRDKQTVRYVMGRDSSNESERQTGIKLRGRGGKNESERQTNRQTES